MKKFFPAFFFALQLASCGNENPTHNIKSKQRNNKGDSEIPAKIPAGGSKDARDLGFTNFRLFKLTDTINIDLTGDDIRDEAFFSKIGNKKGIKIINGASKKETHIGMGTKFGDLGNDFGWITIWGTTNDKTTVEVVFEDDAIIGGREVKLSHTSIFVRKEEQGGGVITFKDGKFIWIHQAE